MPVLTGVRTISPKGPIVRGLDALKGGEGSTYSGETYVPDTIGTFVATDQREMPWNTLGKKVDGAFVEGRLLTASEVLDACGLNWTVELGSCHLDDGTPIPDRFASYRVGDDSKKVPMGIFSGNAGMIQPRDGLSFLDDMIEARDGAHYSSGWSMREMRQIGVTVEIPETIVIDPEGVADTVGLYILGVNSFDGSTAFQAAMVGNRFGCFNALFPTLARARRSYKILHRKNASGNLANARTALGIMDAYTVELDKITTAMYEKEMTDRQFFTMVKDLWPVDPDAGTLARERQIGRRDAIMGIWNESPTTEGIRRTRWGAWNTITEMTEWGRGVRGTTDEDKAHNRAIGTMVGRTEKITTEAWKRLALA